MPRPSPPLVVAITLPLLLAAAVAAVAVTARLGGLPAAPPPETGPLAVAPVEAPAAGGPECAALVAALPAALGDRPGRPQAEPVQPGVRAWAAAPRPVVLRCGLPRPAELSPTSTLLEVDGVRWLEIGDGLPQPQLVTYVAVDRPVYVALTAPVEDAFGPLQQVSATVGAALPAVPVAVR
jgi:hypothetical protein